MFFSFCLYPRPGLFAATGRVIIAVLALCVLLASAPRAQETNIPVLSATRSDLERGVALKMNDEPMFVQLPPDSASETFDVPTATGTLQVAVTPDPVPDQPNNVVLPVYIEDKALARGVTLNLVTPSGNTASVPIPPRRVFLSIPFLIPVTDEVHTDFSESGGDNLVIQVVPKITKKAQVNIDNTSSEGLVADIRYEGAAYLRLKDLLNRSNRRDMDGTFFFGQDQEDRWSLITENVFEKFDARNLGVARDKRMAESLLTHWRFDHVDNMHALRFGANVTLHNEKARLLVGNIDRRVKDTMHAEIGYGDEDNYLLTRFEGLEMARTSGTIPYGMRVDRSGYQIGFLKENEETTIIGKFGNLKVEDLDNEGEIDDYFNFLLSFNRMFGQTRGMVRYGKFQVSGELELDFYGIGSASWLQGEINVNIVPAKNYLLYVRLNNDFARITGDIEDPLWESYYFSFMRNRDYFNPKDLMARLGNLESVYVDLRYVREGKGEPYQKEVRLGMSKYLRIMNYDIPLELYVESNEEGEFRPGAAISIRGYL